MPRLFRADFEHAAIARWLRDRAREGYLLGRSVIDDVRYRDSCTCGVNLEYPNSITLIFTRDAIPVCRIGWHLSVCCITDRDVRGYHPEEGEHWTQLLFGPYRPRLIEESGQTPIGKAKSVQHFWLLCDWNNAADPAVNLGPVN